MTYEEAIKSQVPEYGTNTGHGHVWLRPDGRRARCGGTGMCHGCGWDNARVQNAMNKIDCQIIPVDNKPPYTEWPDGSIST